MEYARLRGEAGSDVSLVDLGFQTDLRVYLHLRQTWMAFSELRPPDPVSDGALEVVGSPNSSFSAPYSDHSEHSRGCHHPAAHLSPEENSHRHCAHQRSQQVGARALGDLAGFFPKAVQVLMPVSLLP